MEILQYLVRAILGSAGACPTCSRAALPRWGNGFLLGDWAISGRILGVFCLNTHVTLWKWGTSFQGPCRTCNLFCLQWWYSLNQFTHLAWRHLSFSAVSGAESASAYCSTKKTCSCIHADRSWHYCRALLELPANAGVYPCKMNSIMSHSFSLGLNEMRIIIYLCVSFSCLSLTTGYTFEVFEVFDLKYVFPVLCFKFVCFFLAVSI